jgi:hypothetical protein
LIVRSIDPALLRSLAPKKGVSMSPPNHGYSRIRNGIFCGAEGIATTLSWLYPALSNSYQMNEGILPQERCRAGAKVQTHLLELRDFEFWSVTAAVVGLEIKPRFCQTRIILRFIFGRSAGAVGFEPPTLCSQSSSDHLLKPAEIE